MRDTVFCRCLSKLFAMPLAAWVVLLSGVGALATAFIAQYGFDVLPCKLCWYQRAPYALAVVMGGLALAKQPYGARSRLFLAIAAAGFFVSTGMAVYHTGVEQHWWEDIVACAVQPLNSPDPATLREQLLAAPNIPCDEITWTFLGLSMANWNIFSSLGLFLFTALAASGCCSGEGKPCRCCSCK